MSEVKEQLKSIDLLDYVESNWSFDKEVKVSSGVQLSPCPMCGHNDCFTVYTKTNRFTCFSGDCDNKGDVIELMMKTGKAADFKEALALLSLGNQSKVCPPPFKPYTEPTVEQEVEAANRMRTMQSKPVISNPVPVIPAVGSNVSYASYFIGRGLSQSIIDKYNLSISGSQALLPCGLKRNLDLNAEKRYLLPYGKPVELFNPEYLSESGIIFICEGIFDALSLETLGHKAISINGSTQVNKLIEQLKSSDTECTIISAFDNDEAGFKTMEKLKTACKDLKISFDVLDINNKYKDVNEWLIADSFELQSHVVKLISSLTSININRADCFDDFMQSIETPVNYISTGFNGLDKALGGGLLSDIYIIGGTPGAGKSAFILQICHAVSKAEIPVLYFSLELSTKEIDARNISRLTFTADNNNYISAMKIKMGDITDAQRTILKNLAPEYKKDFKNFHIDTCQEGRTIDTIIESAEWHKKATGKSPVIVVDYLQILQTTDTKQTEKQAIDNAMTELKRLSNNLNTPVIVIASLNRASYDKGNSMSGYKESGSIEYSAAIAMNIIPTSAGREQLEARKEGMNVPCIETELTIVKNRHYITGSTNFDFYGAGNYFKEKSITASLHATLKGKK